MSKNKRAIPHFNHPIIETHCHLDYLKSEPLATTLEQASQAGVEKIITISVSADNLTDVIKLVEADDRIWGTQGIHPHEAEGYSDDVERQIRQQLNHPRILAVGEIGLDYYYDHADRKVQRQVFEQQLEIATETQLPVVIHTREADDDMRAILSNFTNKLVAKGVIHSFTSSLALAEYCIDAGFCLGFNGISTFNKADNVREVVSATPVDAILLETDAPYLTPAPYRGRENAPKYLPFIAEKLAEVKGISVEELLSCAYENSQKLFFSGKCPETEA